MYKLDINKARKIMVEEQGYTPDKVDAMLKSYPALDEKLGEAVDQWLENRSINDEIEVEGLKIREVMDNQQFHFLIAVKESNRLLDKDLADEKRKKLIEILKHKVYFE